VRRHRPADPTKTLAAIIGLILVGLVMLTSPRSRASMTHADPERTAFARRTRERMPCPIPF
jgi:hypothetical protein